MIKTFHVHLNPKAKEDSHYGSLYHVQRIHRPDANTQYGVMDFGTNSKLRLKLYLLWLRLCGYRKDKRKW